MQQGWNASALGKGQREGPTVFLNHPPSSTVPSSPATQARGWCCTKIQGFGWRCQNVHSAGWCGVWISMVGPAGMALASGLGWRCPNFVQIRMRCLCPNLRGLLPLSPLLSRPCPLVGLVQRVGKGSGIFVIVGTASPGVYWPLTDLAKCSSGEGAQGTPHSCAALAPMLAEMHRST